MSRHRAESGRQPGNTVRIIGIGNPVAGDDAVGIQVVTQVRTDAWPHVEVVEAGLAGLTILDLMEGADVVVLIDAVRSGQAEGTIIRLEIPRDLGQMRAMAWSPSMPSTHAFGLAEALTMGHELGLLPPRLIVYGIELGHGAMGTPISHRVRLAARDVARKIPDELRA